MKPEKVLPAIYGIMVEFADPNAAVAAAQKIHDAGYRKIDAYSPYPVEELMHAIGLTRSVMPFLVLCGGITGLCAGYGLEYWAAVIEYPMNIGGRPLHSWPAFIPPAYETTILFAALTAVFGMIAVNGLPRPYHPVFNVPAFVRASRDRFFVCIEATDPKFDREETFRFLSGLGALAVTEVEH